MSTDAAGAGGEARGQLGAERAAGEDEEVGAAAGLEGGEGGGHEVRAVRRACGQPDVAGGRERDEASRAGVVGVEERG